MTAATKCDDINAGADAAVPELEMTMELASREVIALFEIVHLMPQTRQPDRVHFDVARQWIGRLWYTQDLCFGVHTLQTAHGRHTRTQRHVAHPQADNAVAQIRRQIVGTHIAHRRRTYWT